MRENEVLTGAELLAKALEDLAKARALFHSEAGFQFALAWQLKTLEPALRVRLETPHRLPGNKSMRVDLEIGDMDARFAIELKYLRENKSWTDPASGEMFELSDGAPDTDSYDTVKDIQRLEGLLASDGSWTGGAVVVLTNRKSEWTRPAGALYWEAFRLYEGRSDLTGVLQWTVDKPSLGRPDPITLKGSYNVQWRPWSLPAGDAPELRVATFPVSKPG